jgi:hypothetical protein
MVLNLVNICVAEISSVLIKNHTKIRSLLTYTDRTAAKKMCMYIYIYIYTYICSLFSERYEPLLIFTESEKGAF